MHFKAFERKLENKKTVFAFPWEIEAENGSNLDQEKGHSFFTSPCIFEVFLLLLRKKEGGQKRCILIFQVVFPYLNMFALGNKLYDVLMEKYLILAFHVQLTQATVRGTRAAVTEERLPGKRTGQGGGRGSESDYFFEQKFNATSFPHVRTRGRKIPQARCILSTESYDFQI